MTKVTIWGEGKKMAISGAEGNFDLFYHGNEDCHFDSGGKFSLFTYSLSFFPFYKREDFKL